MFQNVAQTYTLADASSEIALMLLGAFILWATLGWLIKPSGVYSSWSDVWAVSLESQKEDDLQLIEWIGPAIEKLLHKHAITGFEDISRVGVSWLEDILEWAWARFKMHVPTTWPDQAKLAASGKWSELEEYQEILNGGK